MTKLRLPPELQPTENDVKRAVLDYINLQPGFRLWRRNVGARVEEYKGKRRFIQYGKKGMSDLEGIAPGGIHLEIECKRPGKELSDEQSLWLQDCRHLGAIAFWCDSLEMCMVKLTNQLLARK